MKPEQMKIVSIDEDFMNYLVGLAYNTAPDVNEDILTNLQRFTLHVDENIYLGNEELSTKFKLLNTLLTARLKHKLEKEDLLIEFCEAEGFSRSILNEASKHANLKYMDIVIITGIMNAQLDKIENSTN